MRKLYLIGAITVGILILIISAAQFGATCQWYLLKGTTHPVLVLLWTAGLGAIMGGLLVLWWKLPKPGSESEDSDDEDEEETE